MSEYNLDVPNIEDIEPSEEISWYSLDPLLSRGAKLNFCTGGRGIGKSMDYKRLAWDEWTRKRKMWVVMRRYAVELDNIRDIFWDDFLPDKGYETKSKKGLAYIREKLPEHIREDKEIQEWYREHPWEHWGYYMDLASAQYQKGKPFPEVTTMLFDEFIRDDGKGYLPTEIKNFNDIVETVFRTRKAAKVICFSNAGSLYNPYFTEYGVTAQDIDDAKSGFIRRDGGKAVFQFYKGGRPGQENSIVGQFAHDSYKDYAYGNVFQDGGGQLVRPKPKDGRPFFKITKDGKTWITIYTSRRERIWWAIKSNAGIDRAYSMDPIAIVEEAPYNAAAAKGLMKSFQDRTLWFATPDIRNTFIDWIS